MGGAREPRKTRQLSFFLLTKNSRQECPYVGSSTAILHLSDTHHQNWYWCVLVMEMNNILRNTTFGRLVAKVRFLEMLTLNNFSSVSNTFWSICEYWCLRTWHTVTTLAWLGNTSINLALKSLSSRSFFLSSWCFRNVCDLWPKFTSVYSTTLRKHIFLQRINPVRAIYI